ncbi:MAG: M48 family metallopeptidase [Bacteroidales bacterium]
MNMIYMMDVLFQNSSGQRSGLTLGTIKNSLCTIPMFIEGIAWKKLRMRTLELDSKDRIESKQVHIRNMKRKWTSCSSKGRLTFDTEVLDFSQKRRDEIIVHELLHLRYPSHNKMFHRLMERYLG